MSSGDSHIQSALEAARKRIVQAAGAALGETQSALKALAASTPQRERGAIGAAQIQLASSRVALLAAFDKALRENIDEEVSPQGEDRGFRDPTDWKAVGLVGDDQVEERLALERVAQFIAHECDAELREVNAYMGNLLELGWADPSRNPLRGDLIGASLNEAIESISDDAETRRLLVKELGQALARELRKAYRDIVGDFSSRGFRQVDLTVRTTASAPGGGGGGGGTASGGAPAGFEAMRELWEKSMLGRMPTGSEVPGGWSSAAASSGGFGAPGAQAAAQGAAAMFERLMQGAFANGAASGASGQAAGSGSTEVSSGGASDADLMRLLRRLNGGGPSGDASSAGPGSPRRDAASAFHGAFASTGRGSLATSSDLGATNLIRAHHDELLQASSSQLDHMVIEVVASLFDQILADSRVPPQIAREIARLQLPVLRVALRDTSFFSSRRHPVRNFINRISTLASSFGELAHGPGKELLERINALVTEIVEGDFDQVPLYAKKLVELESFHAALTRAEFESTPAAETLHAKESEMRVAQQFRGRMQETLEPLAIAPYLKEFLAAVWSRAIVAAAQGEGGDAAREERFRRVSFDLVASVQPKRSIEQRGQFLATLRGLMASINEGLHLIEWPKAAHDAFFGKLMADQAGSLKAAPGSDLDHNLLMRELEAASRTPLPPAAEASVETSATNTGERFEPHFTASEAKRIGLVDEASVDWSSPGIETSPPASAAAARPDANDAAADLDLNLATMPAPLDLLAPAPPMPATAGDAFPTIAMPAGKTALAAAAASAPSGPEEPTEGPQLRDHLRIGLSYQLRLKDQWEQVRLTYMSPSRTLFLFAHGSKDRGTISMTVRMLERLCDARRLKSFETSPLIDRATERVRLGVAPSPLPSPAAPPTQELSEA